MKFLCEVALDKSVIPSDYRRKIISYMKYALNHFAHGKYFDTIYGAQGERAFSFGVLLPKPTFQKDCIVLSGNQIKLLVSSPANGEAIALFNSLLNQKGRGVTVGDNTFTLVKIQLLPDTVIHHNAVDFKILSPICLRRHEKEGNRDTYISVAHEDFESELKENLKQQLKKEYPTLMGAVELLKMDTSLCKKTVVLHYGQYIESTIGVIGFQGEPALLNAICKFNLGSRKSSGFGLVQPLVEEEVGE